VTKTIARNAKGQPFSKWKPAEKFDWLMRRDYQPMAEYVEKELVFDTTRNWRWDYAWPTLSPPVAVEIDGVGYGHQSIYGRYGDNKKQNAGVEAGWRVLRYDSAALSSFAGVEAALAQVWRVLCGVGDS